MKKVLVTGFDPFGGENINPSWELVKKLDMKTEDIELYRLELPTVFYKSNEILYKKIEEIDPDLIIACGQAGGRAKISLEFVAINHINTRMPDNDGKNYRQKIYEDGEDGYFSNLPIYAIEKNLKEKNLPVQVSYSAGTYVCNNVLYSLLYYRKKYDKNYLAGFVHLPYLAEQVLDKADNCPFMDEKLMVEGLKEIILTTIKAIDK